MKIKLKGSWIIGLFIISYIVYIIILAVLGLPNSFYTSEPNYINYNDSTNLKPFDMVISDTISYLKYKKLKDSIKTIRALKNGDYSGSGSQFLFTLGTGSSIDCDTCSLKWFNNTFSWDKNKKQLNTLYYIQLPSWKLNIQSASNIEGTSDSVQFYVEHGQAYVRKFVPYTPTLKHNGRKLYHMVDIPVRFRYNTMKQCVMIPISKTIKHMLDIVLVILGVLLWGYVLILIGNFIGFLMDVSKGLAFTDKNIRILRRITITLFAIPAAEILLNLLLRLIFSSYLTTDVALKIDTVDEYWKMLTVAVIFLMIYRAFRQGKKIKDEQEFTI